MKVEWHESARPDAVEDRRFTAEITLRLRACREEDLPALEWMGLYAPHRQIIRETFEAQRRGEATMLLADANGFPVAQLWIDVARQGTIECPRFWAVRVFPPLQGSGIGAWLMAAAERLARRRGARAVELGVEHHNDAARRFYVRLGYRAVGCEREDITYGSGADAVRMVVDQQILRKDLLPTGHGGSGR